MIEKEKEREIRRRRSEEMRERRVNERDIQSQVGLDTNKYKRKGGGLLFVERYF